MKNNKRLYGFLILMLVFGAACQKGTDNVEDDDKSYEAIMRLPEKSAKRLAFTMLENNQKAAFFTTHINRVRPVLNVAQQAAVDEIRQKIQPSIYDSASTDQVVFNALVIPEWLKKHENTMGRALIEEIFYFLEGPDEKQVLNRNGRKKMAVAKYYDESAPPCICNLRSSYTCRKQSFGFPSGITIEHGICTYNGQVCDRDKYGCGFMGLWSCNGNDCA